MSVGLRPRVRQRWSAFLLIALSLDACTSWQLDPVAPAQALSESHPDQARVRLRDGRQVVVRLPTVRGDSLVGGLQGDTIGFAMEQIDGIELRRFDAPKTVGLVGLFFLVPAVACAAGGCDFGPNLGPSQ